MPLSGEALVESISYLPISLLLRKLQLIIELLSLLSFRQIWKNQFINMKKKASRYDLITGRILLELLAEEIVFIDQEFLPTLMEITLCDAYPKILEIIP